MYPDPTNNHRFCRRAEKAGTFRRYHRKILSGRSAGFRLAGWPEALQRVGLGLQSKSDQRPNSCRNQRGHRYSEQFPGFYGSAGTPEIPENPAKIFRDELRELNRDEYRRLLSTAESQGDSRLRLVMETICATGIRVSELRFFIVEAVRFVCCKVRNKGKSRTVCG